jgi:SAM-dependent methyltransferase
VSTRWQQIARRTMGEQYAARYAARFRDRAAAGSDVHGEAAFVDGLVSAPARILDAGCGTGRVGVRLAELGHAVVGVDSDPAMVAQARLEAPDLEWWVADLADLDLGREFDVVAVAGNTVPLLEEGTLPAVCRRLTAHTAPGGLVVCGFGLDAAHLPAGCPVTSLAEVEDAMAAAGLALRQRLGGWDGEAWSPGEGYVVTVHERASGAEDERCG